MVRVNLIFVSLSLLFMTNMTLYAQTPQLYTPTAGVMGSSLSTGVGIGTNNPNAALGIRPDSVLSFPALAIEAEDSNNPYSLFVEGLSGGSNHVQISTNNDNSRLTLKCASSIDKAPRLQMTSPKDLSANPGWAIFDYASRVVHLPNASFKMRWMPGNATDPAIDMIQAQGTTGVYLAPTVGNVGIGTNSPQNDLHVAGGIRSDALAGGGAVFADADGDLYLGMGSGSDTDWLESADTICSNHITAIGTMDSVSCGVTGMAQLTVSSINLADTSAQLGRYAIAGISTYETAEGSGVLGTYSGIADGTGVTGLANNIDGLGWGIYGEGGYIGSAGFCYPQNQSMLAQVGYGSIGVCIGGSATATGSINVGIYGEAAGAETNYAGFFAGDVFSTTATFLSDARFKENITILEGGLDRVMQLNPRSYTYKENHVLHTPEGIHYGFVAQELEQVIPEAVQDVYFPNTLHSSKKQNVQEFKSVNYNALLPFIVDAIQEQQEVIQQQQEEIDALHAYIESIDPSYYQSEQRVSSSKVLTCTPNPASTEIQLNYQLVEEGQYELQFQHTQSGKMVKKEFLPSSIGKSSLRVDVGEWQVGIYIYVLLKEGEIQDSGKFFVRY